MPNLCCLTINARISAWCEHWNSFQISRRCERISAAQRCRLPRKTEPVLGVSTGIRREPRGGFWLRWRWMWRWRWNLSAPPPGSVLSCRGRRRRRRCSADQPCWSFAMVYCSTMLGLKSFGGISCIKLPFAHLQIGGDNRWYGLFQARACLLLCRAQHKAGLAFQAQAF